MKLLLIYNPLSGKGKISKKIDFIKESLKEKYDVYEFLVSKDESIIDHIKNDNNQYDIFLVLGGDGTVNSVCSALCNINYETKIGIIPFGTMNDMAANLGMKKNISKSLDIIKNSNNILEHKIYKANENYFDYALAYGLCTGVSFIKRKRFGIFSYYFEGIKLFFKDKSHYIKLDINNNIIEGKFRLLFATNTSHIAGYKIKQEENITIAMFKGFRITILLKLLFYLMFKKTKYKYNASKFKIITDMGFYNGDGEPFKHNGIIDIKYAKTLKFIKK